MYFGTFVNKYIRTIYDNKLIVNIIGNSMADTCMGMGMACTAACVVHCVDTAIMFAQMADYYSLMCLVRLTNMMAMMALTVM